MVDAVLLLEMPLLLVRFELVELITPMFIGTILHSFRRKCIVLNAALVMEASRRLFTSVKVATGCSSTVDQ